MSRHPLFQLSLARLREFIREPEALFWVFFFPILMTIALGLAFRGGSPQEVFVGVQEGPSAETLAAALDADPGVRASVLAEGDARAALRRGAVAVVVVPGDPWTFWFDPTRPESREARLIADDVLQRAHGREAAHRTATREMREPGSRYIDFVVPGLLGLNLMGTGMWGIGFNIVQARSKRLLKRMTATPMPRSYFLLAHVIGRLVFLVPEVVLIVGFAVLVFDVPIYGSLLALAVVNIVGTFTFAGLGLLVASRAQTIEGVSGLMNVVMLPMWIASGVFFSTERFPPFLQPAIQALPLTAINDALRGVMLEGSSLLSLAPELAIASAWAIVSFALALVLFRWK